MDIRIERVADVVILRLRGDLKSRSDISPLFATLLETGNTKFVLSFAGVTKVETAGFTALLEVQDMIESAGGFMRLCSLDEALRKLFKAYGVDHTFSIMRDEKSALDGLVGIKPVNCADVCYSRYLN